MRRLFLAILPVFFAATFTAMPASAAKQKWFGCPAGYSIKISESKRFARCTKPAKIQRVPPGCVGLNIPGLTVGAKLKINATGRADKCMVANTPHKADPLCPPTFRLIVKKGADTCRRIIRIPPKPVIRPVMIQR